MKTLGLIGGLSWQSSVEYYRQINTIVQQRRGGNQAARIVLHSLNFGEISELQHAGRWDVLEQILLDAALKLQAHGADALMICANTMHKVADGLEAKLRIPILHIVDATANAVRAQGFTTVGLLGTRFTMTDGFYHARFLKHHGIEAISPDSEDVDFVHHTIYQELMSQQFKESSRGRFVEIMQCLADRGAQAMILGCTEIPLLIRPQDTRLRLFDTMQIHVEAAVDFAV